MNSISYNIAFVIKNISAISGENPGKKTLQKLVFLIEQKGIDLGCEYGLHFYGPYSATLDNITMFLDTDGFISIDYSGYSHRMKVNENWEIKSTISREQEKVITDVLTSFKDRSPSQLELLTTAIYAYNYLEDKTKDSVIRGVQKIKGSKYSVEEIKNAFNDFKYFNMAI